MGEHRCAFAAKRGLLAQHGPDKRDQRVRAEPPRESGAQAGSRKGVLELADTEDAGKRPEQLGQLADAQRFLLGQSMAKHDDVEKLRFKQGERGFQASPEYLGAALLEYKAAGVQQANVVADCEYFSHAKAPGPCGKGLENT